MFENERHDLSHLSRLDFRDLRAATRLGIDTRFDYAKRAKLLASLCPDFQTIENIGICRRINTLCPSVECEYVPHCKEECVTSCIAHDPNAVFLTNYPSEMESAVKSLQAMIESKINDLPAEVVVAGLSHLAEESMQLALTQNPYEFLVAIRIHQLLYDKYGKLDSYGLDRSIWEPHKDKIGHIWRCFCEMNLFVEFESRIESGDAILGLSDIGRKLLSYLDSDPICFVKFHEAEMEKALEEKQPPSPGHIFRLLWTKQMLPVAIWSRLNSFPIDLLHIDLHAQFQEIEQAQAFALSKHDILHPAEILRLGLPFWGSLFHITRYAARHYPFFKELIKHYSWLPEIVENDLKFKLDHRIWASTLLKLKNTALSKNLTVPCDCKNAQSFVWPIYLDNTVLLSSAIILGFAVKNQVDVLAENYEVGEWFEDIVERELQERKIPIVDRNVPVPGGEIDFICFDAVNWYVIEAKDYGPRGQYGYFSSREYSERNEIVSEYLDSFAKRLQWIKENSNIIGIPSDANIQGIYLSSCEEPHIKTPQNIEAVVNRRLCSIFGGAPVDPLLKLEAMKARPETVEKNIISKPRTKEKRGDFKGSKLPRKVSKFAMRRIQSLFGDVTTFQLYRVAWEICSAFYSKAFCIMELCAEPNGRPASPTKQYLTFVAHRSDAIPLSDIENSYNKLVQKGFIKENGSDISLGRSVDTEYWQHSTGKWKQVTIEKEAELILFQQIISHEEKLGKIAMFIDGLYGYPRMLLMFKEISD